MQGTTHTKVVRCRYACIAPPTPDKHALHNPNWSRWWHACIHPPRHNMPAFHSSRCWCACIPPPPLNIKSLLDNPLRILLGKGVGKPGVSAHTHTDTHTQHTQTHTQHTHSLSHTRARTHTQCAHVWVPFHEGNLCSYKDQCNIQGRDTYNNWRFACDLQPYHVKIQ